MPGSTTTRVPEPVARVATLMSTFPAPWALCGGWAVDAWLARQTRDHGDVDIAVFHDDQRALFDHLAGWQLIAHDPLVAGDTSELWTGRALQLPAHVHGRPQDPRPIPDRLDVPPEEIGFGLDVQIEERWADKWAFSAWPRVAAPIERCIRRSAWGVPTLGPAAVLYYKAGEGRPRDQLDFRALLPRLEPEERRWLRDAIAAVYPGHPWLPCFRFAGDSDRQGT